ncbi:alpha/beta hydrolase [Actinomycetospora chibensis]|uniref:Alpha/beta hydrolase n=1 Tax=Actinomycetospora chibensis TaxID=663606 RepID=A0ABV9RD67_9PSEU|nr:alpha/beta hydrolase [Actinomycetospora chibensis]MDD7927606.1 alpha/beta hydrolase [Actinomycetospora chibensis]
MRLPLGLRLLGALRRRLGGSVAHLAPADVPAAREAVLRLQHGPLGRAVIGPPPRDVAIVDARLPTEAVPGGLPVRVYRPAGSTSRAPVVVNFHGGGFVQGDLDQSEWFCAHVAHEASVVVVSVDYRLAPEHTFPVPAQDCYDAVTALVADARVWGLDPARVAVMGDSAGGNLATVVCLMARDRRLDGLDAPTIAAQVLVYPGTEMVDALPSERAIPVAPILSAADIRGFHQLYLGGADGTHPYASPLRAELAGLPPALVQTAEHDPLRDHGERYVDALDAAGVPVRHTRYLGAAHGYVATGALTPRTSLQAVAEIAAFLRAM